MITFEINLKVMKKCICKISYIFTLLSVFYISAQSKKYLIKENKTKHDKSLIVKTDSIAILEAQKKALADEKASLEKPYHPEDNAEEKINELLKIAQKDNKNIILQAGGNWCIWCLRFNNFVQKTNELKEILDKNFIYYHLNYSKENKNEEIFRKYGNPGEKYGYPVFIVLDKNGKVIHIQDSSVLEEGKGYSLKKVEEFFENWIVKP